MDVRYKQAHKEAIWSLCLSIIYLVAWIVCAYYVGDSIGVTGLPLWFELSCLFAPIAFVLLCWLIVKWQFKNISLEQTGDKS